MTMGTMTATAASHRGTRYLQISTPNEGRRCREAEKATAGSAAKTRQVPGTPRRRGRGQGWCAEEKNFSSSDHSQQVHHFTYGFAVGASGRHEGSHMSWPPITPIRSGTTGSGKPAEHGSGLRPTIGPAPAIDAK